MTNTVMATLYPIGAAIECSLILDSLDVHNNVALNHCEFAIDLLTLPYTHPCSKRVKPYFIFT